MAGILIAGGIAYRQLPVSALPEVDYPTIQCTTFYPGASPDVMASSVTAPLESTFGQVPGLKQMTSTSSYGSSIITLQFDLDLNIDVAEQQVQASINAAGTYLPPDLPNPPIYSKVNPADAPILTLALTSTSVPLTKVEDLADTTLSQKISQLPGVGLVSISGGQKPAVRIPRQPDARWPLTDLSLEDVRTALGQTNINQAKGNFDGLTPGYTIGANDQILTSAGYKPVIIAYQKRRACAARGRRNGGGWGGEHSAGSLDEHHSGRDCEHSAPTRRQYHRRRRPNTGALAAAYKPRFLLPFRSQFLLTAQLPSERPLPTCSSRSCSPSRWWSW